MKKGENEAMSAYVSAIEQTDPSQHNTPEPVMTKNTAHDSRVPVRSTRPDDLEDEGPSNLGYLDIDVNSLPTGGNFYPTGTTIKIRAARGEEIKHWSTMNDQDINQLSQIDDMLNYIIERCVYVKIPSVLGASWKDLKDVDRFYLLLAVREFTFPQGENELKVPLSEGNEMTVTKEMIDFIQIPDDLMQHYDSTERCFVFTLKTGRKFRMHIPSLGVTQWCKNYSVAKQTAREGFDADFILYAPMLISDYRNLSQRAYEEMVSESSHWNGAEWSLLSYVRTELMKASEAKIKYTDDNGVEVAVPLTFRGGIKALFTVQNPLSILC